jgi:hypothetical protein
MALSLANLSFEEEGLEIRKLLDAIDSFPQEGTEWFVVSKAWWAKWEQYVSEPDNEIPGDLDNSDILLDPEETSFIRSEEKPNRYTNFILKPEMKCDVDYILVTPDIWKALVGKYQVCPGSTIRRYSIPISETET